MNEDIKKKIETRYYSLLQRSKNLNIELPRKKDIFEIVKKNLESGFKCNYCDNKLEVISPFPYIKIFLIIVH